MEKKTRKKQNLGNYPFVSVVFSITLSLLVVGMFGLLLVHAKKLTSLIQENIEIQVFLKKNISDSEVAKVNRTLGSKPYVIKDLNEARIRLITKEEAAKDFMEQTGEDFTSFLGDNPLRDLLVINIDPEHHAADSLAKIKSEIQKIGGVYEVAYVESLVESINDNLTKISAFLLGFALILIGIVIVLINNTIKLALFSQRFLIRSMQLVGATSSFIRKPFLKRSIWYGMISGFLSSAILYGLLTYANQRVEDLNKLRDDKNLMILFASLVVLGMLVGFFSTYRSIRKYLKMSLDELY